ncbi:telomere length regulation protein-domain-containing protein [Lineolata rhizophorae]|uniref:Telomere length regulation protein-domain-containing protein n=1 Tax=Lineolata rhizophorae TaxID=578093 RepID=A0A6A6P8L3_9PEZI|nr:telomere length regulation protein-domain-containing protein [Lineolata rhizophorae]
MEGLLTPVKTVTKPRIIEEIPVRSTTPNEQDNSGADLSKGQSPKSLLEILKSQPNFDDVQDALNYFAKKDGKDSALFSIKVPGPVSSQIVSVLVNSIAPNFWSTLQLGQSDINFKRLLATSLRSVSGIGAIIARLRALATEQDFAGQDATKASRNIDRHIRDSLELLEHVLDGDSTSQTLWSEIRKAEVAEVQKTMLWKEYISLIASGKVVSAAAQAEDALKGRKEVRKESWTASGSQFASWLGLNCAKMAFMLGIGDSTGWSALAELLAKTFSLGYSRQVISEFYRSILVSGDNSMQRIEALLKHMSSYQQQQFLSSTLAFLNVEVLPPKPEDGLPGGLQPTKAIGGSAALLRAIYAHSESLENKLISWLLSPASLGADGSFDLLRALVLALSPKADTVSAVLEKAITQFSDSLYIKHTPIIQQEAICQVLLLLASYVHRANRMLLFTVARSSVHMNGVSSRLASPSPRARFLGMIVGTALSELVDTPENRMDFKIEDTETPEAKWYLQLVRVKDEMGSIDDLRSTFTQSTDRKQGLSNTQGTTGRRSKSKKPTISKQSPSNASASPRITEIKGPRIVEVEDESGGEEDDLVPYAKPDSDPEDDEEDPTLIQRDKPRAPVYIRDLIAGLRDTENYDRHMLALNTAPDLIRRKATFGKEVLDHIDELANVLAGLNDQYERDNFEDLRRDALIAVLLAQPASVGQWFSRNFFEGDYSLNQRISILSALGLGARELAGFSNDGEDGQRPSSQGTVPFPSNKLPDKLHKIYSGEYSASSPVNRLTKNLEHALLEPMALDAADKLSGPNALKVRTFSSRMEVEKKRKKAIPNELAKIVAQNMFFPLTGRWWARLQAYGTDNLYFSTELLPPFLRTLALLLHASGPSTLSLPQMTSEFWDLLLSVRASASDNFPVLEALLFSFLILLDVNEDKERISREHAKELVETQEWTRLIFERFGGGDEESERVRMLAAGVLVRCGEVVEKYQRSMMGDLLDF